MTRGVSMAFGAGLIAMMAILLDDTAAWSDGLTAAVLADSEVALFIGEYRAAPGSAVACGGVP